MNFIIQLRFTMKMVHPPIWRVVQVPFEFRLDQLATLIPLAFGWSGTIFHEFILSSPAYGSLPRPPGKSGKGVSRQKRWFVPEVVITQGFRSDFEDEALATIGELCPRDKVNLTYFHDVRTNWAIGVAVQKILHPEPGISYPLCLAGKYPAPSSAIDGPLTFTALDEILSDPHHKDHEKILAGAGEVFDPEFFDQKNVDQKIRNHFGQGCGRRRQRFRRCFS